jgi:hypothetical protein
MRNFNKQEEIYGQAELGRIFYGNGRINAEKVYLPEETGRSRDRQDRRVMATGYNGAPIGIKHCDERGGCLRQKLNVPSGQRQELCMALHAEQNAIIQAAHLGQSIAGGTIYCTHQPV